MDKVNKIITLLENGHHEEALESYQQILLDGSHEERFLLAEELFQYGFLEESKALYERLLEAYPEEGELLVLLAETHIDLGNEEEAILVLERIHEHDPSFPQSLLLLADLYQMDGLFEVSEQKLLKAKELLPDEVIVDFALGELYAEQGRFLEAKRIYEAVLRKEEIIAGINVNQRLADILSAGGAFEDALPYYEKALEDKLEINTLFSYAFTALQAGFNRTAIEKLTELKELDPEYHSLYLYLAQAYEREEEAGSGLEAVKEGIKQDEFNKELYFYGGKLALKNGNEKEAEDMFRQALALDPEYVQAAILLNKLLLQQERYEDVIEITEMLNELEEPQLIWDSALAFQHIEEYSEALNRYQLAYTFFKQQPDFLSDYGYFLTEEGKREEAAEIFNTLIKLEPGNEEYLDMLQRLTDDFLD
ncbi:MULTISPECIES: tetratricopeptide repeat protein [unclassified Cytobacillus]|uniref:tetratricopeptide repeat protein n=1 Tax=unclassified Cytobacillus TaxID=2675268 RepID=UPI00135BE44E|nr:tetratricopeptide repeat protein [Cytobacillus sp. AMY 15.2]KAF0818797.1 TPR-repeat-containing protein [Bacillus sp. ZZV12-4809]MCM3091304.1 tetratricopeptide repeat protein [Cytobacillus sp. AMY 15.2]